VVAIGLSCYGLVHDQKSPEAIFAFARDGHRRMAAMNSGAEKSGERLNLSRRKVQLGATKQKQHRRPLNILPYPGANPHPLRLPGNSQATQEKRSF
jgi:hypothetical protein